MPARENTGSDDFFSSGQFHRVEFNDYSTCATDGGAALAVHADPAAVDSASSLRHRLPSVLNKHTTAGSDADIESPIGLRKQQHVTSHLAPDCSTPTTPSTAGSALVPPSGFSDAARPHLQLDDGQDPSLMHQGFPSTASVDSMFQGGSCFTHFSPQKHFATTGSHGNMHPSYSSSSVATPTSPPQRSTFLPRAAASPPQNRLASPQAASLDGITSKPPQTAPGYSRGAPSSFRPPLVPKLNLAVTNQRAEPPSAASNRSRPAGPSSFLLAYLTPRIPLMLQSGGSTNSSSEGILTDSQQATLRWENPSQSLVRWTMALLTLDVLHTFTTFDSGYTWTTLLGRTMVLLMLCGRLFRATQDSQNDALVSGATFAERLKHVVAERADHWANSAAVAVHASMSNVVLDGRKAAPQASSAPSASSVGTSWIDGFHAACRVGLVCCGLEIVLGHSPVNATRVLDVAIFWCSFSALRVPLRLVLSDVLSRNDGVAVLQRSFLGPVGATFILKPAPPTPHSSGGGVRRVAIPVLRKGPSDILCWGMLQLLFAVCRECTTIL
jgi:hypothetical protein